MHVLDEAHSEIAESEKVMTTSEQSDEFIRNFFIKFGMRRTLESF